MAYTTPMQALTCLRFLARSGAILTLAFAIPVASVACSAAPSDATPAASASTERPPPPTPPTDDAGTPPASGPTCPATVTDATARTPPPSTARASRCTDGDIDAFIADPSSGLVSFECGECMGPSSQSSSPWAVTVESKFPNYFFLNSWGCLRAEGESQACSDAFGIQELCAEDSCTGCATASSYISCRNKAYAGACSTLAKVKSGKAACSAQVAAHFATCNSQRPNAVFMCGGLPTPLQCGLTSADQVATAVVGVAGSTPPAFTGGTIAVGTYVATKVEGFGSATSSVAGVSFTTTLKLGTSTYSGVSMTSTDGKTKASTGSYHVSGTTFVQAQSCPTSQSMPLSYTATATTLATGLGFTAAAPGDGIVITYTKQ